MIAVVTGAGSGIGRAAAQALMADGWSVVLAGRREAQLRETGDGLVVPTDVTDPASVAALFTATLQRYGRVDLLFNNAGVGLNVPITEVTYEDWQRVVDTNLTGSFLCAQAAFRAMAAQDRAAGGSSTTARCRRTSRGRSRSPTPPPSTRSPGSRDRSRSKAARTTSPAGRSTSATRTPNWPRG